MVDIVNKQEEVEIIEKKIPAGEQPANFSPELGKVPERREVLRDDKIVSAEIRRELEMMELDENTKKDVEAKAEKIEFLGEKEKIEHLLAVAREKGVIFAIQMAKRMNEPYLLDVLHDTLAKEGFYKNLGSSTNDDDDKKT